MVTSRIRQPAINPPLCCSKKLGGISARGGRSGGISSELVALSPRASSGSQQADSKTEKEHADLAQNGPNAADRMPPSTDFAVDVSLWRSLLEVFSRNLWNLNSTA
jgi:hypothetical protein